MSISLEDAWSIVSTRLSIPSEFKDEFIKSIQLPWAIYFDKELIGTKDNPLAVGPLCMFGRYAVDSKRGFPVFIGGVDKCRPVMQKLIGQKVRTKPVYPERDKMTPSLRYSILERDNFTCCACGRHSGNGVVMQVDHIIPVSKDGLTISENLQTLCWDCNSGKGNR